MQDDLATRYVLQGHFVAMVSFLFTRPLAFPLHLQFGPEEVKIVDRIGVTAALIQFADAPERCMLTGRVSREQGVEIANAIVRTLTDETL